ncbi:hypothetical protein M0812_12848 [Anaeramoeba flamelloides]|uniref:Uncharacterized protein n=1 Tax=Anaeramoeba flamelloides TaxID=1746091 RepID=A0AAV7ZMZ3_9EUKA|nr:hypothetical protein M0812_12848 [Anaeramoeba flamelloides]
MFHRPSSSSNNNIKRNLINQFLEDKDPKNEKEEVVQKVIEKKDDSKENLVEAPLSENSETSKTSESSENEENKNENVSEKKFESETETEKEKVNDRKKIKNNELIKKFILVDSKNKPSLCTTIFKSIKEKIIKHVQMISIQILIKQDVTLLFQLFGVIIFPYIYLDLILEKINKTNSLYLPRILETPTKTKNFSINEKDDLKNFLLRLQLFSFLEPKEPKEPNVSMEAMGTKGTKKGKKR